MTNLVVNDQLGPHLVETVLPPPQSRGLQTITAGMVPWGEGESPPSNNFSELVKKLSILRSR